MRPNEGKIRGNAKGFAFFVSDDKEKEDIYIAPENLRGALNGDRVKIRIIRTPIIRRDGKREARVIQILERNSGPIIGTYRKNDGFGFVIPDDKSYFKDIFIDEVNSKHANDNDKVIVVIDRYDPEEDNPEGHVTEVIGNKGAVGVDITAIAKQFNLPDKFSEKTLAEVKRLPEEVSDEDREGREDLRNIFTVTIDGADAKDFDDAISIEKHEDNFYLYVHIADVTHYVREGSAIDKDAYERGNSVYLLDRVIPMLPVELSNGLCSLNPGVDRLSVTTKIELDKEGEILKSDFYLSVINSDYRLVYTDVSDYIENGRKFSEDTELLKNIDLMNELYKILAEKRAERGTIEFEFPEPYIKLDADGKPISIEPEERRTANSIIEEFMILNNQVIGSYFSEKHVPFIYRVHDDPKIERVEKLNNALRSFRYNTISEVPEPEELREVLMNARGEKEEGILNMLVLQTMSKAIYSPRPGIHFGLAIDHYSHFTAPIRRYSDIIAHRLLKAEFGKENIDSTNIVKDLETMCQHITETEINADDAERDVDDMKSAEYMQQFIGQTFRGIVSSLTNFGVFIMLDNTVEGLAHFRDMNDDYYTYDEGKFVVTGEAHHREIRYGDEVEVLLVRSNPELREIDFKILWNEEAVNENRVAAGRSHRRKERHGKVEALRKGKKDRRREAVRKNRENLRDRASDGEKESKISCRKRKKNSNLRRLETNKKKRNRIKKSRKNNERSKKSSSK